MIAEKQAATSAIQGKFSTEGLAAMANGTDARMKLAQSLSELDLESGTNLQDMFDVLSDVVEDDSYNQYHPMVLLDELIGAFETDEHVTFDSMKMAEIDEMLAMDLFDISNIGLFTSESVENEDSNLVVDEIVIQPKRKNRKMKEISGQMSYNDI